MWLRLMILFLAIWLLARFLKKFLYRERGAGKDSLHRMVRCEYCGLFLPENETIVADNHIYCSKQHASSARK